MTEPDLQYDKSPELKDPGVLPPVPGVQYDHSPDLYRAGLPQDAIDHCEKMGIKFDELPQGITKAEALKMTPDMASGLKAQHFAKEGKFDELIPLIRKTLHTATASQAEFDRLTAFERMADPQSIDSRYAASGLALEAFELLRKGIVK